MLYGLDVWSGYGKIDWARVVAGSPYKHFGIARINESNGKIDATGGPNIRGMRENGIPLIGGYMVPSYLPGAASAASEVKLFQKLVTAAGGVDFACIDFELPKVELILQNRLQQACSKKILDLIAAFEDARGETPVLYSYSSFLPIFTPYLNDAVRCPLWIANYKRTEELYNPEGLKPTIPLPYAGVREHVIWQYAADGTGSVAGLAPSLPGVDRNVAPYTDVEELREALGVKLKEL